MFSLLTNKLKTDVGTVKNIVTVHDQSRAVLYSDSVSNADANSTAESLLSAIRETSPPALPWRIYDHCAAFTRLYAIYEQFVFELLKEWLTVLPEIHTDYESLPETIRSAHRLGVAEILQKVSGDRYSHLSEVDVLRGIAAGLIDGSTYSLLFDAYTTDDQNLWRESLQRQFKKVGIEDIWNWVSNHGDIQRFFQETRGDSSTAESELHGFVFARNEAAHGVVDNIVASSEFEKTADFVTILCRVLAEAIYRAFVDRKLELGEAIPIGNVIRQFSDRIVGVELKMTSIAVGDELVILRDFACYSVRVESIEVNHVSVRNWM